MSDEEEEDGEDDREDDRKDGFLESFAGGFSEAIRKLQGFKSLEKEGMMDCEHMREPDTVEISVRKAENGFVVEVDYPRRMVPNQQMDNVQNLFATFSKAAGGAGGDQEHDHTSFMKSIGDAISKVGRPSKQLRRAHEEYVFQSMDAMMAFIKETLESADSAENSTPIQK
jgi:hypothetical protein